MSYRLPDAIPCQKSKIAASEASESTRESAAAPGASDLTSMVWGVHPTHQTSIAGTTLCGAFNTCLTQGAAADSRVDSLAAILDFWQGIASGKRYT